MQTKNMACARLATLKVALSLCLLGAMVGTATAQQPTKAQQDALRSACRKDFMSYCSKVKPTGSAALACLKRNAASLSTPCRTAVAAAGGGSAPEGAGAAPAQTPAKDQAAPAQAAAKEQAAAAPTPAKDQAAPAQPTKAQQDALRSACRKDFMSHCSGVKPTGSAALACLQKNAASLSAGCRTAVSAVGGDAASAGATSSAGSTPARAKSAKSSFRLPTLRCGSQCRRLRELLQ
jgi:Cysteine rich repeat